MVIFISITLPIFCSLLLVFANAKRGKDRLKQLGNKLEIEPKIEFNTLIHSGGTNAKIQGELAIIIISFAYLFV